LLAWANHRYDLASFAGASSSSSSVQIVLVIIRWINVNYQADTIDVNSASGNVGSYQDICQTFFEGVQSACSHGLGFAAM
jgi:hypothetical protein